MSEADGTDAAPPKPDRAPTAADLRERDQFADLATASLESVRKSAELWRTGLAAFITLVTGGLVLKGRESTAGLPFWWLLALTVLVGAGVLAAVVGLWFALRAQAGTDHGVIDLETIRREAGSFAGYEIALAREAGPKIAWARRLVGISVALLLAGVAVSWWAPEEEKDPPKTYVAVTSAGTTVCGELQPVVGRQLRVKPVDRSQPLAPIALADVDDLVLVRSCP